MLVRPARGQRLGRRQVPDTSPAKCSAGEHTVIYVANSFLATPAWRCRYVMSWCTPSIRSYHVGWWRGCPMPVCEVLHTCKMTQPQGGTLAAHLNPFDCAGTAPGPSAQP